MILTAGRIKIDAKVVHGAPDGWFKPGGGKTEWFKDHGHGPEMVVLPSGSFTMGSPETEIGRVSKEELEKFEGVGSEDQHTVSFTRPFAVGRHVITRGEFAAFAAATGYETVGSWRDPDFAQDDTHPVVCVSWVDATAYTTWLSNSTGKPYRLLSEAEWEYAARASTRAAFWFGDTITTDQANYDGNFVYGSRGAKGLNRETTVPVESFAANPWGLYQVHGNVLEWCADTWHKTYAGAPLDGTTWSQGGDQSRRVYRGGCWLSVPRFVRCAYRYGEVTGFETDALGFRVGRTLIP